MPSTCPCGKLQSFEFCCGPFIEGRAYPESPEELMRSRYTAFTQKNLKYIIETTHPDHIINFDAAANRSWMAQAEFTELKVLSTGYSGVIGRVEFKAYFKVQGVNQVHHEHSEFARIGQRWYYCIH